MRQLISRAALIMVLVITISALFTEVILPRIISENTYLAASIDKQKRLRELPGKRLVITGGSNAAFSIDGERISKALNKPVVNMGLHAGLGIKYILNETAANVRSGDLVLLVSEYYLSEGNLRLFALGAASNPAIKEYADLSIPDQFRFYCYKLQICLRFLFYRGESLDNIYIRNGFNETGDLTSHLHLEAGSFKNFPPKVNWPDHYTYIKDINSFLNECRKKGAEVVYMFPCFPEEEYTLYEESIQRFSQIMHSESGCEVLGTPVDFIFPYKSFLDGGRYHLAKEKRLERTDKMISLLKTYLETL